MRSVFLDHLASHAGQTNRTTRGGGKSTIANARASLRRAMRDLKILTELNDASRQARYEAYLIANQIERDELKEAQQRFSALQAEAMTEAESVRRKSKTRNNATLRNIEALISQYEFGQNQTLPPTLSEEEFHRHEIRIAQGRVDGAKLYLKMLRSQ